MRAVAGEIMMDDHGNMPSRKTTGMTHDLRLHDRRSVQEVGVRSLARQAIRLMASRNSAPSDLSAQRLRVLCDAFLDEHDDARHLVLMRLRQSGVGLRDIIDRIVPDIARCLGQRWADDDISFAEVTIGSARLQETVRALGAKDQAWQNVIYAKGGRAGEDQRPRIPGARAPRILLVVPSPEHHTLGIFVAADQLRRLGYMVDIALDKHPRQIADSVRFGRYAMLGITAAGRRTLATTREIVDTVRSNTMRVIPIVLGGSILEADFDLRSLTGVDHVAPDMVTALGLCGLETKGNCTLLEVDADTGR